MFRVSTITLKGHCHEIFVKREKPKYIQWQSANNDPVFHKSGL